MARRCEISGKEPQFGHNVSHANNRTNRRFVPNLQKVTLHSDALKRGIQLRVCTRTLRSIQHNGGLDPYLLSRHDHALGETGLRLKRKIRKALSAPKKAAAAG
jgi:large subunit ribosomal protein L28